MLSLGSIVSSWRLKRAVQGVAGTAQGSRPVSWGPTPARGATRMGPGLVGPPDVAGSAGCSWAGSCCSAPSASTPAHRRALQRGRWRTACTDVRQTHSGADLRTDHAWLV